MNADERHRLIKHYMDAYNRFDIDRMMEVVHPGIEFKNISGGQVNARASGAAELRALAEQAKTLFASRSQSVTKFEPSADGASVEINFTGVLAANLPNGMKAGETLRLTGRSEFVIRDGKIYRLTDYS